MASTENKEGMEKKKVVIEQLEEDDEFEEFETEEWPKEKEVQEAHKWAVDWDDDLADDDFISQLRAELKRN